MFLYIYYCGLFFVFFTAVPLHHHNHPDCSCTSKTVTLGYQSIACGCVSGITWETSVQTNPQRSDGGAGLLPARVRAAGTNQAKKEQKTAAKRRAPQPPCWPQTLPSLAPTPTCLPPLCPKIRSKGKKKIKERKKTDARDEENPKLQARRREGCAQSRVPKKTKKVNQMPPPLLLLTVCARACVSVND